MRGEGKRLEEMGMKGGGCNKFKMGGGLWMVGRRVKSGLEDGGGGRRVGGWRSNEGDFRVVGGGMDEGERP